MLNVMKPVSEKLASGSLDPEYTLTNTMVFAGLTKDEMITDPIVMKQNQGCVVCLGSLPMNLRN